MTTKLELKTIITQSEVEVLINNFISKYILCGECNYPEIVIKNEDKKLYYTCDACGHLDDIKENKFTKIILNDLIKNLNQKKKKK